MTFTLVDCNGLNGSLSYGAAQAGGDLLYRTGYLDLGRAIVNANAILWGNSTWRDEIMPEAKHEWERWPVSQRADVVVAVPPCSGFSTITGKGTGKGSGGSILAGADHPSNDCMWSTARYAGRHAPLLYAFESVTGAFRQGLEVMRGLRSEMERISGHRYTLTHWLHDGVVVGAPSSRQRYLFVAVRGDAPFRVTPVNAYARPTITTVEDAVGDLVDLPLQWGDQKVPSPTSSYQQQHRRLDGMVDGHQIPTRGKYHGIREEMYRLGNAMGDNWRQGESMAQFLSRLHAHYGDQTMRDLLGTGMADRLIANGWNMGPYTPGREVWAACHRLIAGGGPDWHVHPVRDRVMTYREAARVQGWPDELRIDFDPKFGKEAIDSVWGKAVMPTVAVHVGREIADWLENPVDPEKTPGELMGDREWLIDDLAVSRQLRRQSQLIRKAHKEGRPWSQPELPLPLRPVGPVRRRTLEPAAGLPGELVFGSGDRIVGIKDDRPGVVVRPGGDPGWTVVRFDDEPHKTYGRRNSRLRPEVPDDLLAVAAGGDG